MKQKKCPQCKNLVSVNAPTCLYCGRPNKFVTNNYIKKKWVKEHNNKTIILKIITFKRLLLIIVIFLIILFISLYK